MASHGTVCGEESDTHNTLITAIHHTTVRTHILEGRGSLRPSVSVRTGVAKLSFRVGRSMTCGCHQSVGQLGAGHLASLVADADMIVGRGGGEMGAMKEKRRLLQVAHTQFVPCFVKSFDGAERPLGWQPRVSLEQH